MEFQRRIDGEWAEMCPLGPYLKNDTESLKQMYKCIQRGGVGINIIDLRVLGTVI